MVRAEKLRTRVSFAEGNHDPKKRRFCVIQPGGIGPIALSCHLDRVRLSYKETVCVAFFEIDFGKRVECIQ